jgi:hypothetical protein
VKLTPFLFAVGVAAAATAAVAAEAVWKATRSIEPAEFSGEQVVSVRLDADVFKLVREDLVDLRVLDSENKPVAFVVRTPQTTRPDTVRRRWTATDRIVKPLDSGGLEVVITLGKDDAVPGGLMLVTPLQNFEQRVQVFTSVDGSQWEPAAEQAIYDYTRYMDARNVSISIPATDRRHFRVVIDNVTAEQESELLELTRQLQGGSVTGSQERVTIERRPFRIDRIEFWRDEVRQNTSGPLQVPYAVAKFSVEQVADKKQTHVLVETSREPLTSFTLASTSRNFSRRAEVQIESSRGKETEWATIGSGTLAKIDLPKHQRNEMTLRFSKTTAPRYRIVIENLDSPAIEVTGVEAEGPAVEAVFLAKAGEKYQLAYGAVKAEAPHYDTAAIEAAVSSGTVPVAATLGAVAISTAAPVVEPFSLKDALNNPKVLIPVILVLVVVLGWGLYQAAKHVETLPPEEGA